MKKSIVFLVSILMISGSNAQTPKSFSSSDILQQFKKLEVFGSVLYIAAHPDDENTRLLAYLANERMCRTGYLSLTRGDGGQNLIGNEQGIDLGLIRTQELLAARRVDGAEQFFSTAYDFGYSKSPEETIQKWGHDKILSDVVWVIRKFRPDVIITRFPTTGEGGHGHHTASAILAGEAFEAAADASRFPEQLKDGITAWQAKRLLWNTFNFGGNNTQRDDQLKIDVGMYNPILGKSYGEMAAESRSQHKSQGFGVPAQRGESIEYFAHIKGDKPLADIMDGVDMSCNRLDAADSTKKSYKSLLSQMMANFNPSKPQQSLPYLASLNALNLSFLDSRKKNLLNELVASCAGLFMEATVANPLNVLGDSLKYSLSFNNRTGVAVEWAKATVFATTTTFDNPKANVSNVKNAVTFIDSKASRSQPYWLANQMNEGSFEVKDPREIGAAENTPTTAVFQVMLGGQLYQFTRSLQYKYTDPVKGELYEPFVLIEPVLVSASPELVIFSNQSPRQKKEIEFTLQPNLNLSEKASFVTRTNGSSNVVFDSVTNFIKGEKSKIKVQLENSAFTDNSTSFISGQFTAGSFFSSQTSSLKKISYDHIPDVYYHFQNKSRIIKMDLKIAGSRVGYISGAGDKVPQALEQMGYEVVILGVNDMNYATLKKLDAIITGVRAYNTNLWLSNAYDLLMQYVNEGGVLLVQYNTNNSIGPVRARIAPYPFNISRSRITDEKAEVNFLLPDHSVLNYPNKIGQSDFDGWVQERSIYNAEGIDSHYQRIFGMKDPGEQSQDGSLIVANFGKGRFVYTGLVFFRELPAGIPGAYRLLANLIAPVKK